MDGVRLARVSAVPYSIVTQLRSQIQYLCDLGMRVTIITSPGPEIAWLTFRPGLQHVPIEIRRKPALFHDLLSMLKLVRALRKHRIAIVHSTTPKAGVLTALAATLAGVPVRLHTFTGQPWITMTGLLRIFSRISDRIIGLLNTRCYADSHSQRQLLIDEHIITKNKIGVIGPGSLAGIDLQRFNADRFTPDEREKLRRDLGLKRNGTVLVFIGRITRDKGILELLSAFGRLRELHYDVDLLLVGPIDEDSPEEAVNLRETMARFPEIKWIGYTDTPERYLAISHLLCLPSYREGFGTVVLEAAAMGLPTLGTRISGLADSVVDGQTGILVPPRDADALFTALRSLLDHPDRIACKGSAAKQRCLEIFKAEIVNEALAQEYSRLTAPFMKGRTAVAAHR